MSAAGKIFQRLAVVLSAGLMVLAIAALLWMMLFLNRAAAPVRLAVNAAQTSDEFRNTVGEPIQTGKFVRGNIVSNGGYGNADLIIPIAGNRRDGVLQEWAQQQSGKWHLCSLSYRSKDGQTQITILPDESAQCERE